MEKFRKNIVGGVFILGKKVGFDRFLCGSPESIYGKITGFFRFLCNSLGSIYRKILSFLKFFCVPVRCRTHICKKVKVF